jgi:uncharacterized membrane protein
MENTIDTDPALALIGGELLNARLTARRSLSPAQFRVVLLVVAGLSCAISIPFVLAGAWPVLGFMGLDVVLVYLAFASNFRAAAAYEDVSLSAAELTVVKVDPAGRRREWRFHPWWVRLERQEDEEFGLLSLSLVSRERRLEIASCLAPKEKAQFARALAGAIAQARRGPRYS